MVFLSDDVMCERAANGFVELARVTDDDDDDGFFDPELEVCCFFNELYET